MPQTHRQQKNSEFDIRAFVELPQNYLESDLYIRWEQFRKSKIGYTQNFRIDELRNLYSEMSDCRNFLIENLIDRGNSIDFYKEWKGILAKCADRNPISQNPYRICEAADPFSIAIKPFQMLRGAKLIRIDELSGFREIKANGRLEMIQYIYITGIQNIINFFENSLRSR